MLWSLKVSFIFLWILCCACHAQLNYEQHIASYLGMSTKYRSGYQRGENGYHILFTRRYKIPRWYPPKKDIKVLTLKSHAKYLGVILDSKLIWKQIVEERVKEATSTIYVCIKMLGKTWGISSRLIHWCYIAIARPILYYGAMVWWTAVSKKTYIKPMERVQRKASICITGALGTSPADALNTILNLPPIDIYMEYLAGCSLLWCKR